LVALVDDLAGVLDRDSDTLGGLDSDGLRARVGLLRRLEGLTTVALARTLTALTRAGGVRADGAASPSAWLQAHTGRSARDAARLSRLAGALDDLPATAGALAAGQLTAEAADTLVRTVRDGRLGDAAAVEAALVPVATATSPEQLRREVRRRTQLVDGAALWRDERRQHAQRRLTLTEAPDGMFDLVGRLSAAAGNRARTLLDAFDTPDPAGTPPEQRRDAGQRLADAFDQAVTALLDGGTVPTRAGQARPHVAVVVDLLTLTADLTDPDRPGQPIPPEHPRWADLAGADTEWAGTLSPQAARQLCCDANLTRVVAAGPSQVLDVGRATRDWPTAIRTAIHTIDGGCRGPNCDRPIGWTQLHHITWWSKDGETSIRNGAPLCFDCHDLPHHHGWTMEMDPTTRTITWTTPDGRVIVTHPRRKPHPP
jgi:hypothetical protein